MDPPYTHPVCSLWLLMMYGQHLTNIVIEFVKNNKLLDSDEASQILFYLNTSLRERERWGKLGKYQIDPQSTQVWRLCIEKKKTQF